jgi:glycosyltransferase involved in cell wall biosynthesis
MKSKTTLVSIGIPFYNSEQYLDFAIRSVLNQTYTNWELFLLDDGSTDKSLTIARKYESDSRVIVISDGLNKGLPARLNELSELANGKYYARMDADDIMFPERIELQVDFLNEHPDVDVVGSSAVSIDNYNRVFGKRMGGTKVKTEDTFFTVLNKGYFIHPTVMGKRDWFRKNQYDIKLKRAQDLELWCRSIKNSNFFVLEEALLFYREIGLPNLKKVIRANWYLFIIARKHSELISPLQFLYIFYNFCKKSLIYMVFNLLGLSTYLVKRRSQRLVIPESDRFNQILIMSTM